MAKVYKELYKMQTVYLKGEISKFGEVWKTNCSNLREILRLIGCQSPGFDKYLIDMLEKNRGLEIVKGSEIINCVEDFIFPLEEEDIIITEVPTGAGESFEDLNPFEILLLGVGVYFGGAYLLGDVAAGTTFANMSFVQKLGSVLQMTGISLGINAISAHIAPGPETEFGDTDPEEEKAKLFNGPINVSKQGIPIPLLYGQLLVGGAAIQTTLNIPSDTVVRNFSDVMEQSLIFGDY